VTSFPDDGDDGDVREIARALRRRKLLLIGIPILFIAIAVGVATIQDRVYSTSALVSVEQPAPPVDGTAAPTVEGDRLVRGERDFVESDEARSEVTRRIGDHEQITTSATEGRDVIKITATDADPDRAAEIANTYAATYLELRRASESADLATAIAEFDRRIAEIDIALAQAAAPPEAEADPAGTQRDELIGQRTEAEQARAELRLRAAVATASGSGQIVDAAETPGSPARPDTTRYVAIALLTGLIAGIAVALVRDSLDRSVRLDGRQADDVTGLTVLTVVPQPSRWRRLLSGRAARAPARGEAFRSLRAVLSSDTTGPPPRLVQVVGPRQGRLVAETVVHVGEAYEQAGHRVLLVSGDLRHSRLPDLLDVPDEPGLVSLLSETADLQDALYSVGRRENLMAVPPGPIDIDAPDLLATEKLTVVLEQLRDHAEVVFMDGPPVLTAADSLEVAAEVDGTVLVVVAGRTKVDDVRRAAQLLEAVGGTVLGCVVYQTERRGA
jgi:capsular exopolysaccharide synthesis family protein